MNETAMNDTNRANVGELDAERIQREKEFHNHRFTEETRIHQKKYYQAIRHCTERYLRLVAEKAVGADVLEYGCAKGDRSLGLAPSAKSVKGIDISDDAIAQGNAAAAAAGLNNAQFMVMNAEAMTFPDQSFDLVFGSGIIHHLHVERSLTAVRRVLRPGGVAIFCEPLGHNVLINRYRDRTPDARTPDEHPLMRADFVVAQRIFGGGKVTYYGLTSLGAVFLAKTPLGGLAMGFARALDSVLLSLPVLRWQAWYTLIEWQRRN